MVLGAAVASGLLEGCKEDDDPRTTRAVIGSDGGQISSHDGVLTLLFLPGALDGDEEVTISPSDTPPLIFGPAYRVKPDVELAINAEVTYARALPNDPTGTAVAAIRKADFESGNGMWIKLPTIELDESNDLVTATDSEISLFYGLLQGDDVSGTTSTGAPTTNDMTSTVDPDETSDGSSGEAETDDTSSGPLSHADDIQPIWNANCLGSGCHSVGQSSPTLEGDAYDALVGAPSAVAAAPLVTAGDSALSYVMHKLDATHLLDSNLGGCGCAGAGSPMPSGQPKLPDATLDIVREWIDQGAPR